MSISRHGGIARAEAAQASHPSTQADYTRWYKGLERTLRDSKEAGSVFLVATIRAILLVGGGNHIEAEQLFCDSSLR